MQSDNPLLDGLARFFTDATGAAQGARSEFEADMALVRRDEFEAVKAMAAKAREENQQLAVRLEALERRTTP